ncbi:uncharacterized protein LOC117226188 isoform X2 [Megalopta genalis]|uniref:uncharacterized protein LOC117226188 isoform X2 n=1 Tax=Megalopta genalis TaxID=115081 RepID=UPI003FD49DE4
MEPGEKIGETLTDCESVKDCKVGEAGREIAKLLRDRSISESLITTLLKVGFADEFGRLLKTMGVPEGDIAELERLWTIEAKNRGDVDSIGSLDSSSSGNLSPDGTYLRNSLSKPLSRALREIVATKPFDPIEYLAHWLLNYKVCQEREKRRKELDLELMIERERRRPKEEEREEGLYGDECEEEEECAGDWDE